MIPPIWQFFTVAFSGWVNRQQQAIIEYLKEENRILREQEPSMIHDDILGTIGSTPVVRLNRLAPNHVEMFVKCEAFVSRVVDSNSIQVQTQYRPLFRPER